MILNDIPEDIRADLDSYTSSIGLNAYLACAVAKAEIHRENNSTTQHSLIWKIIRDRIEQCRKEIELLLTYTDE